MKKIFISLIVSFWAVCASNAQEAFFESVKNIAAKLGIEVSDTASTEKMLQYCRMLLEQYETQAKGDVASKPAMQRTAQRDDHNDFTNRVRFPDVSKRTQPKYYYLKNVATGKYLSFRGPESSTNSSYEAPLYTVDTPDENSKFYFVPGENMLGYPFYLLNDNCGAGSGYVFHGPATNVWKYPSNSQKPQFYFNVADDNSGFYISDASKIGVFDNDNNFKIGIGNVWTRNADGEVVTVSDKVLPGAIWVAEALPETYGNLGVVVEPFENADIVWYVLKNVGDNSYLHYEGNGNVMKTVAAPDTCSLFYGIVGADGKVKLRNCAAGDLECAGVGEWAECGVLFDILPTNEDNDNDYRNDTRFVISMSGTTGKWAVENGELVVSQTSDNNAVWELERISNLKEVFGGSANSGREISVEVLTSVWDIFYGNDAHFTEFFASIAALLINASNISHELVCENIDDMRLFLKFPELMKAYADGAGRILKYSGIYNAGYLDIDTATGLIGIKGLATNSTLLTINDMKAVMTGSEISVMDIATRLDHIHTNMWQIRTTGFYQGGSLSLSDDDISLFFYNTATKMYLTAPYLDGNGNYVVGMTPDRFAAGYYDFDGVSVDFDGQDASEILNMLKGYYGSFRLHSRAKKNVYVCLENKDDLTVTCIYTDSPNEVEGIDWAFCNYTSVVDERVYNHASDAVEVYPQLLQEKYGLATDCDYYSTNAPSPDANYSLCNLLDKEYSTVFWSEADANGEAKHYIQADFGEDNAVSEFYFYMKPNLSTSCNLPASLKIEGSNNENGDFVTLAENVEMPGLLYDMYYFSDLVNEDGEAYRYLRFTVTEVNVGENEFTLSEFYIYPNEDDVALAKQEIDAFYNADYLGEEIVVPAAVLMMHKAEYLLETNAPDYGETPDDKYLALQDAVAAFNENCTPENIDDLFNALEGFEGSRNNAAVLPAICIVESAWEDGFAHGKAMTVDMNSGDFVFHDSNIWDMRQWIKIEKYGTAKNVYMADVYAAGGSARIPVEIVHIPGWNNQYESAMHAYTLRNYGASYYIAVGQNDEGVLVVTESDPPVTTDSNKNAAWYLKSVSDTTVGYIYDGEFIVALAEFGKIMSLAKYYNDNERIGRFVYISEDSGLTKADFDRLYEDLNYYYSKGPVEVVKMYQSGQITPEVGEQIMSGIQAIVNHFPNFVFYKGYFRLRSQLSGNYVVSQPDGKFSMSNGRTGDAGLKSIYYVTPSDDMQSANVLSYEDGRYLCADANGLKYDRIPELGKSNSFQSVYASLSEGVFGFYNEADMPGYYLVDDGTSVGVSSQSGSTEDYKWSMEFVDKLPVVISSAKFATFYSPMELQIPVGVTAYVVYG